jgi:hypothetical protein
MIKDNREEVREAEKEKIETKSKLTLFFLTILVGIAIDNFVTTIKPLLDTKFSFSFEYFILYWSMPIIFLITVIRFFIGNILHMIDLEAAVAKHGVSPKMWLWDFGFLILEAIIFIWMGMSANITNLCPRRFIYLFIILLSLDTAWISSTHIFGYLGKIFKYFKAFKRDTIPWGWAVLNFISGLILILVLNSYHLYNYIFFNILLILFVILGVSVYFLLSIMQIISTRENIIKRKFQRIILISQEYNGEKFYKILPIMIISNLFISFITYKLEYIYNFETVYLLFITFILFEAAIIDIYFLDIYRLLTDKTSSQRTINDY